MSQNDLQSLTDFGCLRLIITPYCSLIGAYNGLPSFRINVRPTYIGFKKNEIYEVNFESKFNQCFEKICQVCRMLLFPSEDYSMIHKDLVSFSIWDVFKHHIDELLPYCW